MSRARVLLLGALLLPACTGTSPDSASPGAAAAEPSPAGPATAELNRPSGVTVVPGAGEALAVATSEALYASAPVVVVAPAGDVAAQARAASVSVSLGAPLLLSPAGTGSGEAAAREVDRLGGEAVVAVGADAVRWSQELEDVDVVAAPDDVAGLSELGELGPEQPVEPEAAQRAVAGLALDAPPVLTVAAPPAASSSASSASASSQPVPDDDAELPELGSAPRLSDVVVLASAASGDALAPVATARAAGAEVHVMSGTDPRGDGAVIEALSAGSRDSPPPVLALGSAFGEPVLLEQHVAVAATGVTLPAGGQLVLPGKLYVALYGHPGSTALGVLGEQSVPATVARAKELAASYEQAGSTVPVVPTFEIITTVASSALGDGDYSAESTLDHVRPLIEAAGREGVYVVLDLQPGYDDFLTQAKMYEEFLSLPHVGLALDPEWRLKPGERHMKQIGRVSAAEVNSVVTWLADLTRDRRLPQKMLLLHQFKTYMLEDRDSIITTRPELAVVTQMDGHGAPGTKMETWNVLRPGSPPGMSWGWKNFYDEDSPTLTPRQTLAVEPTPVFVSYQ